MRKVIVISPSGNFYGSEQVLYDYLRHTTYTYEVYVPHQSMFYNKLKHGKHELFEFTSVIKLYIQVFFKLLTGKYQTVYVNEAGHSRYIHLLAGLFPRVRFVIHIRILEDTVVEKWKSFRSSNTKLVTISRFVKSKLPIDGVVVYDLFDFPDTFPEKRKKFQADLNVALIGRVSFSKGFKELVELAHEIDKRKISSIITINIYGDIMDEVAEDPGIEFLRSLSFVKFHGFVANELIYQNNDLVLHLSKMEPLGRIFFEAVSAGLPLVGFKSGGIGEIAGIAGLDDFVVEPGTHETVRLLDTIHSVKRQQSLEEKLQHAFMRLKAEFGVPEYVATLDNLIVEN